MRRRAPTPPDVETALDALYAQLPRIDCVGACWDSCGPIRMTPPERKRIAARGVDIPDADYRAGPMVCPALTMLHQCAVYEVRPMICRLWGLIESMPCNFGCRPEGGLLTDEAGYEMLARAHEVAGQHADAAGLRSLWSTPQRAAATREWLRRDREQRELAWEVRRRRALSGEAGAVIFVRGRGHIATEPPARGANSAPGRGLIWKRINQDIEGEQDAS